MQIWYCPHCDSDIQVNSEADLSAHYMTHAAGPHGPRLSADEVLAVLLAVDRGEISLRKEDVAAAADLYAGNCRFELSNGWVVVVFNDCDCFDYIDSVTAPDGRSIAHAEMFNSSAYHPVIEWTPADAKAWGMGS